jgi:lipoprotein LpqB-like beta-propeller protein
MNKELLNQIPQDEQLAASKLFSAAETMQVSPAFQWKLETQLMEAYETKTRPAQGWVGNLTRTVSWTLLALGGILILSWAIRSVIPDQMHAQGGASNPENSFELDVRQGNICTGPLAVAHNFSVSLTNADKTGFIMLDEQKNIGELRSFAWSPDGRQLAIVGNTTGQGNIYLTNSMAEPLQPVLANSELGYLMGASWSQDGKLLVTWSVQDNKVVYLLHASGIGFVKRDLPVQIFETPQFTPGHESITFYGADSSLADGLFQIMLNSSRTTNSPQITMISDLVEDEGSFAWSPDGLRLAYIEMDRRLGEANLVIHKVMGPDTGDKVVIASIPIPKGSGSSIPSSANLSWSPDGKTLAFEFGRSQTDRAIYLAYADGTELIKLADAAHAPAISADGKCLAYISNKKVFLLDLTNVSPTSTPGTPVLLADLPIGRAIADFRMDKLQWGLGTVP